MGGPGSGRRGGLEDEFLSRPNPLPAEKDGRAIWERWEGEPLKAFQAFQIFRDLPPLARTVAFAFQVMKEKQAETIEQIKRGERQRKFKVPRSSQVFAWAQERSWYDRVDHYDRFLDRQRIDEAVKGAREMTARHVSLSAILQNKAVKRLKEMTDSELTPKLVLDYIVESVKIERGARSLDLLRMEAGKMPEQRTPVTNGEDARTAEQAREELLMRLERIAANTDKAKAMEERIAAKREELSASAEEAAPRNLGPRLLS